MIVINNYRLLLIFFFVKFDNIDNNVPTAVFLDWGVLKIVLKSGVLSVTIIVNIY